MGKRSPSPPAPGNGDRQAGRCLASIRKQDFAGDLELIVVNDGSDPRFGVEGIARRYVNTDRPRRISTTVSWSKYLRTMREHHPDLELGRPPATRRALRSGRSSVPDRTPEPSHCGPAAGAGRTIATAIVVYHDSQPWFEVLLESLLKRRFTRDPEHVHLRVLLVENPPA